jgi:hypothetical protein
MGVREVRHLPDLDDEDIAVLSLKKAEERRFRRGISEGLSALTTPSTTTGAHPSLSSSVPTLKRERSRSPGPQPKVKVEKRDVEITHVSSDDDDDEEPGLLPLTITLSFSLPFLSLSLPLNLPHSDP